MLFWCCDTCWLGYVIDICSLGPGVVTGVVGVVMDIAWLGNVMHGCCLGTVINTLL